MLQFEFNGHTSDEYGLIVTRIEENDTLVNRSLQLGEKNYIDQKKISSEHYMVIIIHSKWA